LRPLYLVNRTSRIIKLLKSGFECTNLLVILRIAIDKPEGRGPPVKSIASLWMFLMLSLTINNADAEFLYLFPDTKVRFKTKKNKLTPIFEPLITCHHKTATSNFFCPNVFYC